MKFLSEKWQGKEGWHENLMFMKAVGHLFGNRLYLISRALLWIPWKKIGTFNMGIFHRLSIGILQEFWKIDMFLGTFRLLECAISNLDKSLYKDFWVPKLFLDIGTWQYFKIQKCLAIFSYTKSSKQVFNNFNFINHFDR